MAEAIAVVGALSSFLQVIEFTASLASHTHEILESNEHSLAQIGKTKRLANEYKELGVTATRIEGSAKPLTEQTICSELGLQCKEESDKLLSQLKSLELDEDTKGVKRLVAGARKATKYMKERKLIEQRRQYLQELNGQLATATLQSLYENQQQYQVNGARLLTAAATTNSANVIDKAIACVREQEKVQKRALRILESLHFKEISQRSSAIEAAYSSTYEWTLREDAAGLRPWLATGSGIFWISGKAGSGKSTLMKFLSHHDETRDLLTRWCRKTNQTPVSARHYFWYAGSSLQKSTAGLMRTILHQILDTSPELIAVAFPALFAATDSAQSIEWTESQLLVGLGNLAPSGVRSRKRYCFFIDGLDEFHGNHTELVTVLAKLAQNENIKLCVSSRPWTAFRDAYETDYPTLRLEDLTRPDIRYYVSGQIRSALKQHHRACSSEVNQEAELLISEIASKAEGVFLWVFLVVKSVVSGLSQHDPISMLRHRVRDFPADLDDFFRNMLSRVDSVYKVQTRQALKLAYMYAEEDGPAKRASSFLDYWLIRQQPDGLSDPAFPYCYETYNITPSDWAVMRADTRATLSAACKDLLHLPAVKHALHVEFLHRTVYDFLRTSSIQQSLDQDLPDHFKNSQVFHLLNLARLNITSGLVYPEQVSIEAELLNALDVLNSPPHLVNDTRYTSALEKKFLLCYQHSRSMKRTKTLGLTIDESIRALDICLAYQMNDYAISVLNNVFELQEPMPHRVRTAALGIDPRNHKSSFGVQYTNKDVLARLNAIGALDGKHDSVDDGGCSQSAWQLFLRKWSIVSEQSLASSNHCQAALPIDPGLIWNTAKIFLIPTGKPGFDIDVSFCSNSLPPNDLRCTHKRQSAVEFLKTQSPPRWFRELVDMRFADNSQVLGKRKLCEEEVPIGEASLPRLKLGKVECKI